MECGKTIIEMKIVMKYMLVGKDTDYQHGRWFILVSLEMGKVVQKGSLDGLDVVIPFEVSKWSKTVRNAPGGVVYTVLAEVVNSRGLEGYLVSDNCGGMRNLRIRQFIELGLKYPITNFTIVKPLLKRPFVRRNANQNVDRLVYELDSYAMNEMLLCNKKSRELIRK